MLWEHSRMKTECTEIIETFRSEDEDDNDNEYEFSVMSMRTLTNVGL